MGVIAAQSIGGLAERIVRRLHAGAGIYTTAVDTSIDVCHQGVIRLHRRRTVRHGRGHRVAVSYSGAIAVLDAAGRERERHKVPYGACIAFRAWRVWDAM